ncbi:MAG: hypothetical protein PHV30_05285 [Candidatus Margulisbacteria bacterium]|nr:hypothetical protein [Candidatus Margulisiibacteriota bacterium]
MPAYILVLMLAYLLGCLPGLDYASKKINKSRKFIHFSLDNGAMVSQYREFKDFWLCFGFEAFKWLIFFFILSKMDFFLFCVFILGVAVPFWNKFKLRNLSVYFLLYLIWANFVSSVVLLLLYALFLIITKYRYRYVNLLIVTTATVLFWGTQVEAIYLQELLLFFFFLLVDVIAGYLSNIGKKAEPVTK